MHGYSTGRQRLVDPVFHGSFVRSALLGTWMVLSLRRWRLTIGKLQHAAHAYARPHPMGSSVCRSWDGLSSPGQPCSRLPGRQA